MEQCWSESRSQWRKETESVYVWKEYKTEEMARTEILNRDQQKKKKLKKRMGRRHGVGGTQKTETKIDLMTKNRKKC